MARRKTLSIRVSSEMMAWLQTFAEREQRPVSEVARRLLDEAGDRTSRTTRLLAELEENNRLMRRLLRNGRDESL